MNKIENYKKLVADCKIHQKQALLNVLHNKINADEVTGIPSNPEELYTFLKEMKKKIERINRLTDDQRAILFPSNTESVDSQNFDVTLIRLLIGQFCNIKNAKGNKCRPDDSDTTLWAYVYRAAKMRNKIFHKGNILELNEESYKDLWREMKTVLDGLKYQGDVRGFLDHLKDYKDYYLENASEEFYIERRFSFKNVQNDRVIVFGKVVTEIDELLKKNDQVNIYGEAGIGKTVTARKIKYDWSKGKILPNYYLLYFKSKTINRKIKYPCYEAPFYFSEIGEGKGKPDENFLYHDCVTRPIDNLFILIDGIDEFPIKNLLNKENVDELEKKVRNNEEVSAAETIYAIYYGFLFPNSKICLLGRIGEFQRLKEVEDERNTAIFNQSNRKTADLEILKFNEENIKDFTCFKICNQQQNGQNNSKTICTGVCHETYEKIKDIELCKVPTDLNSLIELQKKQSDKNIGRITRTKLMIATLLNRLNQHIYKKMKKTCKSFREIREEKIFNEYLECIQALGEISFYALLKGVVTVEMEGVTEDISHLEDENQIKIRRTSLEEMDFFYIRDAEYNLTLEPYHLLNMEFLSSCYLFSHKDKWDSIVRLNRDRQHAIITFIAGLHADDPFTRDFVKYVLNYSSDYSLDDYFDWMYNVHTRLSKRLPTGKDHLPDGNDGYVHWFGVMKNRRISPSFYLLDSISHEVDLPKKLIPFETIVYLIYRYDFENDSSSEFFNMNYFKHTFLTKNSDKFNIKSFLEKYPNNKFEIRAADISVNERFIEFLNRLHECQFIDCRLSIREIHVEKDCHSGTIEMLLDAILHFSHPINCLFMRIDDIRLLTSQQFEKACKIVHSGVVYKVKSGSKYLRFQQLKGLLGTNKAQNC